MGRRVVGPLPPTTRRAATTSFWLSKKAYNFIRLYNLAFDFYNALAFTMISKIIECPI